MKTPDEKLKEMLMKNSDYTDSVKSICEELLEAREVLRLFAKCDGGCARYECVCHTKIALKFLNNWSEK